jgi:hypothetical protein
MAQGQSFTEPSNELLDFVSSSFYRNEGSKDIETVAGLPSRNGLCSELEERYLTPKTKMDSYLLNSSQM